MHAERRRFLLYSHDSYGLGHLRRSLAIAWGLHSAFPRASFLCVTGSPRPHSFAYPPRTDYLKLPSATKDGSGRYVAREMSISFRQLLAFRTAVIEAAVRSFRPHLILVDHAPLGMAGELLGALRRARGERRGVRILLGLRDIYDEASLVRRAWRRQRIPAALEEIYDRILVYGQAAIFDVVREYGLEPAVARKIVYTGYVHRRDDAEESAQSIRARLGAEQAPLVLLTVGGGEDGHRIVHDYLQGLAALGAGCPWRSLVVMGPLMNGWRRRAVKQAARALSGVTVLPFLSRLGDYLAAADVVLTMGGYNTLVEALALRKRTVVVPRVAPRKEQQVRAERFSERGLLRWLDLRRLSPEGLVAAVREALESPPPDAAAGLDLNGVERTVREVADLLVEGAAPPAPVELPALFGHASSPARMVRPTDDHQPPQSVPGLGPEGLRESMA